MGRVARVVRHDGSLSLLSGLCFILAGGWTATPGPVSVHLHAIAAQRRLHINLEGLRAEAVVPGGLALPKEG